MAEPLRRMTEHEGNWRERGSEQAIQVLVVSVSEPAKVAPTLEVLFAVIIERSGQMVRYCFLMNGGAVVALLAFLGQVCGQRVDVEASRINTVVLWFVFGLVAGVVASIADYIALSRLYQEQEHGARRGVK